MKLFYLFVLIFFQANKALDIVIENIAETYSNGSFQTDSFEYIFSFSTTPNDSKINAIINDDLIFNIDRQYEIKNQDNISIMFESLFKSNFSLVLQGILKQTTKNLLLKIIYNSF